MARRSLLVAALTALALLFSTAAVAAVALLGESLGSSTQEGNIQPLDDNHPPVPPRWQRQDPQRDDGAQTAEDTPTMLPVPSAAAVDDAVPVPSPAPASPRPSPSSRVPAWRTCPPGTSWPTPPCSP